LWSSPPKPATCFPQHPDALAVQQTMLLLQPNQAAHLLASGMSLTHASYQLGDPGGNGFQATTTSRQKMKTFYCAFEAPLTAS